MRFDYLYGCQLASRQIAGPRRCALAAPTPLAARGAENFYGAHITQSQRIYEPYTKEQLELLLEFVREGARARAQGEPGRAPRGREPRTRSPAPTAQAQTRARARALAQPSLSRQQPPIARLAPVAQLELDVARGERVHLFVI